MMPTADQIARVIIAAARELRVDPVRAVTIYDSRGISRSEFQALARARIYAANALVTVYGASDAGSARMVGISRQTAPTWFSSTRKQWDGWFDPGTARRVCDQAPRVSEPPRPAEPVMLLPAFLPKRRPEPAAPVRIVPSVDIKPRVDLDRFGGARNERSSDPLTRRATERVTLKELLAEAARNTRAMQDRMNDGKAAEDQD